MAQDNLVVIYSHSRRSVGPSGLSDALVPGSSVPFCFLVIGFNSIAVEATVLRVRGLLDSVILALLKAEKSTSHKVYNHTFKAHFALYELRNFHPGVSFLKPGLD